MREKYEKPTVELLQRVVVLLYNSKKNKKIKINMFN